MKTTNVSKFTRLAYVCLPSVIIASAAILVCLFSHQDKVYMPSRAGPVFGLDL